MATTRPLIKALLIDISGNLHIGSTPTPKAVEALHRLRASNIPFRLCSNASRESTAVLISKLNAMGFDFSIESSGGSLRKEVWTSIGSVAQYVQDRGFKRPYMLLSDSARNEVFPEESSISESTPYDAVIIGLAPSLLDYTHLNAAFRILTGEGEAAAAAAGDRSKTPRVPLPLIATHRVKYIEKDDPPGLSLGPGPFVAALEAASGCEAHVVGKPTKAFFELVIADFSSAEVHRELDEEEADGRIAIVGDDVEADLGGGALELGLWRVLVKTGKYRPGDEARPGVVPPDEVYDNFAAFIDDLLSNQNGECEGKVETNNAGRCNLM